MTQHQSMTIYKMCICGGIDIGSRSHFVAVGQGRDQVKEFGGYAVRPFGRIWWTDAFRQSFGESSGISD